MADKKRVYIIRRGTEIPDDDIYSSLTKMSLNLEKDISYDALAARLRRAKKRTGIARIRMKDENGNPLIVEVRDVK